MTESQGTASVSGPVSAKRGSRVAGLDGCRALAAVGVVTFHVSLATGQTLPFSVVFSNLWSAVPLFFSLSAFLLYRPFAAAIVRGTSRPRPRSYFRNRFLRIAPLYWLVLLAAALLGAAVVRTHGIADIGHIRSPVILLQDLLLVQNYNPAQFQTGMITTWSLTDEVAFYLLVPVLGAVAYWLARGRSTRASRRNAALVPAVVMLCLGVAGRLVAFLVLHARLGSATGDWNAVVSSSILCKADLFAYGLALAVLRVEWEDRRLRLNGWCRVSVWAALLLVGGWVMTTRSDSGILSGRAWTQEFASGIAAGLLLMLVTLSEPADGKRFSLVRLLESRLLIWGGLISYGVFLWHLPVLIWLSHLHLYLAHGHEFTTNLVEILVLTSALAAATYRFVERPALRARRRPVTRSPKHEVTEPVRLPEIERTQRPSDVVMTEL